MPAVALEVLELTKDDAVPVTKIAEVIQNDQALAAKILRTVNSSFYGLSKPCPSISRAVAYLGMNTVKSLVLGFSIIDVSSDEPESEHGFSLMRHWRAGVYAAASARAIATRVGGCDPEEPFVAALLQDIGILALYTALGPEYELILDEVDAHDDLPALEHDAFGFDHARVGQEMAAAWRFPEVLLDPIGLHHRPEDASDRAERIVTIVVLGNLLSDMIIGAALEPTRRRLDTLAREWFELETEDVEALIAEVQVGGKELARMFNVAGPSPQELASIRARAGEQLLAHQIAVERQSTELRRSNDELTRQTLTDGLTGVANRKRFDEHMESCFTSAKVHKTPIAVLFLDADKFKSVNDTYGHQAGDLVLVELARRMMDIVGDRGEVCRYGGEEFAIILPGCDRPAAAELAETLRAEIARVPIDISEAGGEVKELAITSSVGVAAMDASSFDRVSSADQLVHAADNAVYAAKRSGRNCVRVLNFQAVSSSTPIPSGAGPQPGAARRAPSDQRIQSRPTPTPAPASTPTASGPFHVVLVEDDVMHANLIAMAMADDASITLKVATDAEAAINHIRGLDEPPGLIVCDLGLPDMGGVELIRVLRNDLKIGLTPIVVLSASDDNEMALAALGAGANAYVTKQSIAQDPRERILTMVGFWRQVMAAA